MNKESQVRQILLDIELTMYVADLWQDTPPETPDFDSKEPFCVDSMAAEQWLQWVFLPRLHVLLDQSAPLPERCAITPYFEEALGMKAPHCKPLLENLQRLDNLLNKED